MNPCPVCSSASFQHLFRCRPNRPDIPGTYSVVQCRVCRAEYLGDPPPLGVLNELYRDRKSTRLNSSHEWISYAVFCLKKKIEIHASTSSTRTEGGRAATAIPTPHSSSPP